MTVRFHLKTHFAGYFSRRLTGNCHAEVYSCRNRPNEGVKNHCFHPFFGFNRLPVNLLAKLKSWFSGPERPEHLRRGELGERAAKAFLQARGLGFLTANYRSARGEIDLVFRDGEGLVFVEVKTRSSEGWSRPARAVDARKRRLLSLTALDYLKRLEQPAVKFRFDIVEVLLADGTVREVRHLPDAFPLAKPYRHG